MNRLQNLPTSILYTIGTFLCMHCQRHDQFVNADFDTIRTEKAALARLLKTNARLRRIFQPILFHYFSNGSLRQVNQPGRQPKYGLFHYESNVTKFLIALIENPCLGLYVRSMQLIRPEYLDIGYPDLVEFVKRERKSQRLGLRVDDWDKSNKQK